MKIVKQIIQIVIGFLHIMLLWYAGAYFGDSFFPDPLNPRYMDWGFRTEVISVIVVGIMPVLLLVSAVIGKRYNFKALYISSALAVALPVIGVVCGDIFSDDGNILSWIFAFTIALPLYPFMRPGGSTFNAIDTYLYATQQRFLNQDLLIHYFVVIIAISLVIYMLVKPKEGKIKGRVAENYVDTTNQQNFMN